MTMPFELYVLLYTYPTPAEAPEATGRPALGLVEGGALLAWVATVIGLALS